MAALAPGGCAHAQRAPEAAPGGNDSPRAFQTGASGHLLLLGANMLVSAFTSGALSWHRGGSFSAAFGKGALGGATVYAGKALVVKQGSAAPFLGRQLAAVGASAVRNAGAGEPLLADVSLPLGPIHVHVGPRPRGTAPVSIDVLGVATLAAAFLSYDARMDWQASLAAAAPVLVVSDPEDRLPWNGRHVGGNLLLRDVRGSHRPFTPATTLAHERVHLLEYDQMALLWSEPMERALLERWRWTRRVQPYVDLGFNGGINAALRFLPEHVNPIEIEARFLAGTR